MADTVDPATRSRMMSKIRGRDTGPELRLRRALHKQGFRFRLHRRDLPGRPDIVLPRHRAIIFVHGCFWHRHEGCRLSYMPASNAEFWSTKFAGTIRRDAAAVAQLKNLGWRVAVVWECTLREPQIQRTAVRMAAWLKGQSKWIQFG